MAQQPTFGTPTIAGLAAAWWEVALPLIHWCVVWVETHTTIVLGPGWEKSLNIALSATVMAAIVRWHLGPTAPPAE